MKVYRCNVWGKIITILNEAHNYTNIILFSAFFFKSLDFVFTSNAPLILSLPSPKQAL